uniref:Uncharacterized protein n=1 Tax=Romanomermis culicivorax TaxID=13658 RepID=A0A915IJL7_ROMCU
MELLVAQNSEESLAEKSPKFFPHRWPIMMRGISEMQQVIDDHLLNTLKTLIRTQNHSCNPREEMKTSKKSSPAQLIIEPLLFSPARL